MESIQGANQCDKMCGYSKLLYNQQKPLLFVEKYNEQISEISFNSGKTTRITSHKFTLSETESYEWKPREAEHIDISDIDMWRRHRYV